MGHNICGSARVLSRSCKNLKVMHVDLVIINIMLKGRANGIDLAHYINRNLHIPFIFQSSVTCVDTIHLANQTHPNAFLPKPVSKTGMTKALAAIAA